jgi:hypothetical protein
LCRFKKCGPVAQLGLSVRLIIERSPVQIRLGPPSPSSQEGILQKVLLREKCSLIVSVFMIKNNLTKEKVIGTNCFNCKFIANNNEPVVSQELNIIGGIIPKNDEEMSRAEIADLITLPGGSKADASSKKFCYNKKIEMYVTARMCCAYWDNDGVSRPWKKQ